MNTDNWNERELELFDAFLGGFEESAEGFNGEYRGRRYRGTENEDFRQRMLQAFVEWRNG